MPAVVVCALPPGRFATAAEQAVREALADPGVVGCHAAAAVRMVVHAAVRRAASHRKVCVALTDRHGNELDGTAPSSFDPDSSPRVVLHLPPLQVVRAVEPVMGCRALLRLSNGPVDAGVLETLQHRPAAEWAQALNAPPFTVPSPAWFRRWLQLDGAVHALALLRLRSLDGQVRSDRCWKATLSALVRDAGYAVLLHGAGSQRTTLLSGLARQTK